MEVEGEGRLGGEVQGIGGERNVGLPTCQER